MKKSNGRKKNKQTESDDRQVFSFLSILMQRCDYTGA